MDRDILQFFAVVQKDGRQVQTVTVKAGSTISAGTFTLATGAWANAITLKVISITTVTGTATVSLVEATLAVLEAKCVRLEKRLDFAKLIGKVESLDIILPSLTCFVESFRASSNDAGISVCKRTEPSCFKTSNSYSKSRIYYFCWYIYFSNWSMGECHYS